MATMKRIYIPLAMVLSATLLLGSSFSVALGEERGAPIIPVPLAGLLMNPNIPPGTPVSVVGYFGGNFLYLTEDHAKVRDYSSAILIVDKSADALIYQSPCRANYVKVTGELNQRKSGELELDNISGIKYAESGKDCYRNPDM